MLQVQQAPISSELAFFVKLLSLLVVVILLPVAALVVYFLKRGPDMALKEFRVDLNGLGGRMNSLEGKQAATDEKVSMIHSAIATSQGDIMRAIEASGQAQIRAVHLVEIEVARLQERSNLGDCLASFGASIERLANAVASKRE